MAYGEFLLIALIEANSFACSLWLKLSSLSKKDSPVSFHLYQ